LVGLIVSGKKGVLVEVNSETDFVARNDLFQGLVKMIAQVAADVGTDLDKINAAKVGGNSVADAIATTIAKIGENMTLRRAGMLTVGEGAIGSYVHSSVTDGLGKIGVLVALESKGKPDVLGEIGRKVAMHVAAANPQAVDAAGLDKTTIERERGVLADKARATGKPDNVIEKIVDSGLKTFYKEVTLLDQAFVHDPSKSVAQALKESEGQAGAPIRIGGFLRYALGEGVEKQEQDFAAEVAAAAKPN
jgi:elongation factor Ts